MELTTLNLFALGIAGILIHVLVDVNKINHSPDKNVTYKDYFKIEWAAICMAVILVGISVVVKSEIAELENAGNWLGIGFAGIGFMANSVITGFQNKAQKFIDATEQNNNMPSK